MQPKWSNGWHLWDSLHTDTCQNDCVTFLESSRLQMRPRTISMGLFLCKSLLFKICCGYSELHCSQWLEDRAIINPRKSTGKQLVPSTNQSHLRRQKNSIYTELPTDWTIKFCTSSTGIYNTEKNCSMQRWQRLNKPYLFKKKNNSERGQKTWIARAFY